MTDMKMSDAGLRFLIAREGNVSSMYNDNAGHCTIGVGHLVHHGPTEFGKSSQRLHFEAQSDPHSGMTPVQAQHWNLERPFFSTLSGEQVMDLLHTDIQRYEKAVNTAVTVQLLRPQFDALVSFCFNVGASAFAGSTLVKYVNQGKFDEAAKEFAKWVKSNHRINSGLMNRREHERALFSNADYRTHEHAKTKHLRRPKHAKYRHRHHAKPAVPAA